MRVLHKNVVHYSEKEHYFENVLSCLIRDVLNPLRSDMSSDISVITGFIQQDSEPPWALCLNSTGSDATLPSYLLTTVVTDTISSMSLQCPVRLTWPVPNTVNIYTAWPLRTALLTSLMPLWYFFFSRSNIKHEYSHSPGIQTWWWKGEPGWWTTSPKRSGTQEKT